MFSRDQRICCSLSFFVLCMCVCVRVCRSIATPCFAPTRVPIRLNSSHLAWTLSCALEMCIDEVSRACLCVRACVRVCVCVCDQTSVTASHPPLLYFLCCCCCAAPSHLHLCAKCQQMRLTAGNRLWCDESVGDRQQGETEADRHRHRCTQTCTPFTLTHTLLFSSSPNCVWSMPFVQPLPRVSSD